MDAQNGSDLPPHVNQRRRDSEAVRVVAIVVVLLMVAGVAVFYFSRSGPEPRPSVQVNGWSGQAMQCSATSDEQGVEIWDIEPGQLIGLDGRVETFLTTNNCLELSDSFMSNREAPSTQSDASYFVFVTGHDREDVRLVDVNTTTDPATITIEHEVLAPHCARTDEWRGKLLLLIEAPIDATTPQFTGQKHHLSC